MLIRVWALILINTVYEFAVTLGVPLLKYRKLSLVLTSWTIISVQRSFQIIVTIMSTVLVQRNKRTANG